MLYEVFILIHMFVVGAVQLIHSSNNPQLQKKKKKNNNTKVQVRKYLMRLEWICGSWATLTLPAQMSVQKHSYSCQNSRQEQQNRYKCEQETPSHFHDKTLR